MPLHGLVQGTGPFFCEQTFLFEGVLSDSIDATLQSEGEERRQKRR